MRSLIALFLLVAGCGGLPIEWEKWQFPAVDATAARRLRERAAAWEERLFRDHISPQGLLLYRTPASPHEKYGNYCDLADQAAWSGHLLAALAFRSRVEPCTAEAMERLRCVVRGMRSLHDATGVPGYLARCLLPEEFVAELASDPEKWQPAATGGGLSCRLPPSKDQYAGYLFGLCTARALVDDPEVRAICDELLSSIARHWTAGGFCIRDAEGGVPEYCNMRPRILGVPIGVHAAIGLAIVRGASAAEPALAAPRRKLEVERLLLGALEPLHFEAFGIRNYSNDMMAASSLAAVAVLERSPRMRAIIRHALLPFLSAFRGEGNAFFCSLAALYGIRDRVEEENALRNLLSAPIDLRLRPLDPELFRDAERRLLNDRKGRARALHALPLGVRVPSSSIWRSDPYVIDSAPDADGSLRVSGVDLVLAYWMGRFSGWVPAADAP